MFSLRSRAFRWTAAVPFAPVPAGMAFAGDLHSPSTWFAFTRILAAELGDRRPFLTICVARAFAFAACGLSGIGYLRWPGSPNSFAGIALRAAALSFGIDGFFRRPHVAGFQIVMLVRAALEHQLRMI